MKSNFVRISLLAVSAVAACAQSVGPVKAYIPFEFGVPGATMPAGTYVVDLNRPYLLVLQSMNTGVSANVLTNTAPPAKASNDAGLAFHRIGERYFLTDVWSPGTFGRHVPTTKEERSLAKRGNAPDRVIVAAR
jgi:hypothetical protein